MHGRVRGRLGHRVGPYPAGTPYRADDPELLMWILFTLVDSALVVYQKYVRSLARDEQEALWADYRVIGRLFGLRKPDMPADLDALDDYRTEMLGGDRIFVSDWARERARAIVLRPPIPWPARPLLETANFITIALLPDPIRRQSASRPWRRLRCERRSWRAGPNT
jgi:uncharacterized protein (DUF2236 family)